MTRNKTRRLTLAAMMGAVSFVLMYFSFSVPVLSPFASFDLSALPDLIGGFVLGPVGAVEIIAVKVLLKLVFKGTSSMFTGEIQKFLLCTAYTVVNIPLNTIVPRLTSDIHERDILVSTRMICAMIGTKRSASTAFGLTAT